MRIFYTTPEFVYKGKLCPGIPFLCDDNMEIVAVVTDYLLWLALENAYTAGPATWKSHAETLYDYFSWLAANRLAWDSLPDKGPYGEEISNLSIYRNWSADLVIPGTRKQQIALSTIRKRLSHIMSFYRWALHRQRITALPWEEKSRVVKVHTPLASMYRHTHVPHLVFKDNLRPNVPKKSIPFLSLDQCRILLTACGNPTLKLMTRLMLQTGIRNEECRSFPRQYIFDPASLDPDKRIPLELSPDDMALKGSKPRRIYVSKQMMKDLFDYLNFGEGAQRSKMYRSAFGTRPPVLFLNRNGSHWSDKGLNNAYRKLWASEGTRVQKLSFRVTPHMLRHTFATLELYAESQRKNLGAALAWVRDRLGHSSLTTTTIYVHCLDMMGEQDLNQYQREIDVLGTEAVYGKA
ncbi:Tyrosine recombinase XerC [Serratia fonticola]|nr:Tyrosine recombinase XerC [Serratia fonticola]